MKQKNKTGNRNIHLSIVSHGQWHLIKHLLDDLNALEIKEKIQVTLTINIAETIDDCAGFSFPVHIIKNETPQGFGANHNQAFNEPVYLSQRDFFFVINPDVRIKQDILAELCFQLESDSSVGVVAPLVLNNYGNIEDSVRVLPTPWLILKKLLRQQKVHCVNNLDECFRPDWIAGMFMGFRSIVFKEMLGFDERFFLYYEDVNLCSRLWLKGYHVQVDPHLRIIHNAQRSSHRDLKFLKWHLTSMMQFFFSRVFRQVWQFHRRRK